MSAQDPGPTSSVLDSLGLPPDARGVLPIQVLRRAVEAEFISSGDYRIRPELFQPASLDLRLGPKALRIRCSFLPGSEAVDAKVKEYVIDELDLRDDGAVLETNRPYLVPLLEELSLPPGIRGRANPKSSTGRLDVFTRVITDHSSRFDEIVPGYRGRLYLEIVPLSFTVRVHEGLALNQLRLSAGRATLGDDELHQRHAREPLVFLDDRPLPGDRLATADGLFLGLDLRGDARGKVGYRATEFAPLLDMGQVGASKPADYWEPVHREPGDRIILAPEKFYLLLSNEAVRIPPGLAAEMTAYDPTSGELRTHYAGFFDPGFGFDRVGRFRGSRAALEVRAHDVPFMIEHGQRVCKLTFEQMAEPPTLLYGEGIGSNYQQQVETLSKHFVREVLPDHDGEATAVDREASGARPSDPNQLALDFGNVEPPSLSEP